MERRVAVVQEPNLLFLREVDSVFALAERALSGGRGLSELAADLATDEALSYDAVYDGRSDWKLLQPIDCPGDPHRVHVSGTGLTHLGSARDRQAMHLATVAQDDSEMTDSMRMFEWGAEGDGQIVERSELRRNGSIRVTVPFSSRLSER